MDRIEVLEANMLAMQHAMGAVFTAIAEMDSEAAAGLVALLDDFAIQCSEMGEFMVAQAIDNLSELALTAAERGK